ncbi:MAG TPA: PIG-L deacetylase family protein [Chloroflexota bacterium]|nr:PIG-L deacetylase family protein [Chloroflexota bacterium]
MARTFLVIMSHPDDAELTCAGSIARWVREGNRAVLVVATDGARGGKHEGVDAAAMAATRRREQESAAAVIGFSDLVHLGFPDGELTDGEALRGTLVEQVRRFRPDVVVVMDPLTVIHRNSYVNHRDHRMLGMAALDALYPEASNAAYFPEQLGAGLRPHKVPELLLTQTERPNYWVDVGATLEVRFEALRRHASQIRLWPENGEAVIRQQRELAAVIGVEHGFAYAEEFRRIVVNPLS